MLRYYTQRGVLSSASPDKIFQSARESGPGGPVAGLKKNHEPRRRKGRKECKTKRKL